jgi:hypothetical protein
LPISLFKAVPLHNLDSTDTGENQTSPASRPPLDLSLAFFPKGLCCQCQDIVRPAAALDSADGVEGTTTNDTVQESGLPKLSKRSIQDRLKERIGRTKAENRLCLFPTLLSKRCVLREIRDSDVSFVCSSCRGNEHIFEAG